MDTSKPKTLIYTQNPHSGGLHTLIYDPTLVDYLLPEYPEHIARQQSLPDFPARRT